MPIGAWVTLIELLKSQHIDLLPQDQNFCLEHYARPPQVDHHSKDQSAQIQHRDYGRDSRTP
jgi:hypothetical protein